MEKVARSQKIVSNLLRDHLISNGSIFCWNALCGKFPMWYGKTYVTSYKLRVTSYELKASKQELKFKSTSSNPRVQ